MPAHGFSSNRRRLTALRLAAQRIGWSELSTPAETVTWLLALQGQDFPGAKWSVGLRQAGASEAGVDAACDAGQIVRSWPLRGTLHLVAAPDLGWLLELTGPRSIAASARRRADLGITAQDVERAREVAVAALQGRRVLTRDALLAAFEAAGVGTAGQRGYHVLWHLALNGTLVLGPVDGRGQGFVLLEEWVPVRRRLERDEALGELALRYFRSHGPATERDLARWSGLTLADVRRGLAVSGDRLTTLEIDEATYHVAPEALTSTAESARVHLLPGFDEYVLGYLDRTAAVAPEHSQAIVPGGNGMFRPTVVVDGEVVGTWGRVARAGQIVIEPVCFGRLSATERDGLAAAARAYGAFLGRPVRLAASGSS
jgi:hypothetical protein